MKKRKKQDKKKPKCKRLTIRISDDFKSRLELLSKNLGKRSLVDTIELCYWIAKNNPQEFIICPHCKTINFAKMEIPIIDEIIPCKCGTCGKDFIYNDKTEKVTIIK